ncbi:hypothetical protein OIE71_31290 [Streptomyces sp. NBC_01725]|uniref:hypothetical protein n=1 Tax=Streptomyces sp. NBC_01725 TaxID=2975923 RepID=UPI002E2C8DBB|nr:hypothetical protein [Streptomyces sp. NBC_01725]
MSGDGGGTNGPVVRPRADVTVDGGGRLVVEVTLPLPATARPRLLLQPRPPKGQSKEGADRWAEETGRVAALEPAGGDRWRAVLEAAPALEEGRWDAYVLGAPGEERVPLLPGLRDLRALVSGAGEGRGVPLAVRIPYATKDGRLAVRAWLRVTHAEAGRIDFSGSSMTVTARLFGALLGDGAVASLHRRGRDTAVREIALRHEGDRDFAFTVDYRDLTAGGGRAGAGAAPEVWDVYVRPAADAQRIRVARLLDDVADRKAVFVYPATALGGVTARPYYTVDNDLAVEVAPPAAG